MAYSDVRALALLILTYTGDFCDGHIQVFYDNALCRQPRGERAQTAPVTTLVYLLQDITVGMSFPPAKGLSAMRPHLQLWKLRFWCVRRPPQQPSSLAKLYAVDEVAVCRKGHKRLTMDMQTGTQIPSYIMKAPSSLYATNGWKPSCQSRANTRSSLHSSVGSREKIFIEIPVTSQKRSTIGPHAMGFGISQLTLHASFLSLPVAKRKPAPLDLPCSPATSATITPAGLRLFNQRNSPRILVENSVKLSGFASTLLHRSNSGRVVCFSETPSTFTDETHRVYSSRNGEPTTSAEYSDLAEEEEESRDITEELQEETSTGSKNVFETAVSDDTLRDMVRLNFLHNEEEDETLMRTAAPFVIDGPKFNGCSPFAAPPWGTMERMVPYDRCLSSLLPFGDAADGAAHVARKPVEGQDANEGVNDFWRSLATHATNWNFYVEPGSRMQGVSDNAVLVTPPITPGRAYLWTKDDIERGSYEDAYADGTVRYEKPSYLNPALRALCTGRRRDTHRRTDTGEMATYSTRKQKKRWSMEKIQGDIPRGNWTYTDDIYKDMLDSVDWEREWPHLHDNNYYKRSHYSTLTGDQDRNEDSYWDPQFIGAVDTYPRVLSAGMNFTWPVYWVPWLCKKHPRRGGQPLKSTLFNLGGVEPLQLWFYPDGCELSHPGFCALKLVSRPGWNLPFRIKMWIQGTTIDVPGSGPLFTASTLTGASLGALEGHLGRGEAVGAEGGGAIGRTDIATAGLNSQQGGRFLSRVEVGPVRREEADYVAYATNFCRLLDKKSFLQLRRKTSHLQRSFCYNPATDVVLGAAGDVDIGVAVAEENWEWDDGHWSFEQWLKLQSAYPDDLEVEEILPAGFTNSDMFENYKYRDVPDRHYAKYLPSALPPMLKGEDFDQMTLNRRHAY